MRRGRWAAHESLELPDSELGQGQAGALYGRTKRLLDLPAAQLVDLQPPLAEQFVHLLVAERFHRDQVEVSVLVHAPVLLGKRQIRVNRAIVIVPKLAEMLRLPDFLIAGIIAMRVDPPLS